MKKFGSDDDKLYGLFLIFKKHIIYVDGDSVQYVWTSNKSNKRKCCKDREVSFYDFTRFVDSFHSHQIKKGWTKFTPSELELWEASKSGIKIECVPYL